MTTEAFIPIKTVSEGNIREHWHKAASRHTAQRMAVEKALAQCSKQELPCTVELIRYGLRKLDSDNLQFSFKWIRDAVADWLVPGLKRGRADDDPRITWEYGQTKVKKGEEGFKIAIHNHGQESFALAENAKHVPANFWSLHRLAGRLFSGMTSLVSSSRALIAGSGSLLHPQPPSRPRSYIQSGQNPSLPFSVSSLYMPCGFYC